MGLGDILFIYFLYFLAGIMMYGGTFLLLTIVDYKLGRQDDSKAVLSCAFLSTLFGPLSFLFLFMPYSKKARLKRWRGQWILIRKVGPFTCRQWIYWSLVGRHSTYWHYDEGDLIPDAARSFEDIISMQRILVRAIELERQGHISGIITAKELDL